MRKLALAALATLALVVVPSASASAAISPIGPGCATNSICVTTASGTSYGYQGTGTLSVKIANVTRYCAQTVLGGPVTRFKFGNTTQPIPSGDCSTVMKGATLTQISR